MLIAPDVDPAVRGKQKEDDAWELPALAAARAVRGDKELMMGGIMLLRDQFMYLVEARILRALTFMCVHWRDSGTSIGRLHQNFCILVHEYVYIYGTVKQIVFRFSYFAIVCWPRHACWVQIGNKSTRCQQVADISS